MKTRELREDYGSSVLTWEQLGLYVSMYMIVPPVT
jgi:hypothetical protein